MKGSSALQEVPATDARTVATYMAKQLEENIMMRREFSSCTLRNHSCRIKSGNGELDHESESQSDDDCELLPPRCQSLCPCISCIEVFYLCLWACSSLAAAESVATATVLATNLLDTSTTKVTGFPCQVSLDALPANPPDEANDSSSVEDEQHQVLQEGQDAPDFSCTSETLTSLLSLQHSSHPS